MKREEIKNLLGENATPEVIDAIMEMNGRDINTAKADYQAIVNERDGLKVENAALKTKSLSADEKDKQIAKLTKDLETQKEEYEIKITARAMEDSMNALIGSVENVADKDLLKMAVNFENISYDLENNKYDEKAFKEQIDKLRESKPILFTDGASQGPIGRQPKQPTNDISKMSNEDLINL